MPRAAATAHAAISDIRGGGTRLADRDVLDAELLVDAEALELLWQHDVLVSARAHAPAGREDGDGDEAREVDDREADDGAERREDDPRGRRVRGECHSELDQPEGHAQPRALRRVGRVRVREERDVGQVGERGDERADRIVPRHVVPVVERLEGGGAREEGEEAEHRVELERGGQPEHHRVVPPAHLRWARRADRSRSSAAL